MRHFDIDDIKDEHLRRLGEPEPLRSLRRQAERIEHEKERRARCFLHEIECERLRREIRDAGHEPCA